MKTTHTLTALALAALLCASASTSAFAQERRRDARDGDKRPNREQILERFDTNDDGKLDHQERDVARRAIRQQDDRHRSTDGERGKPPRQRGERPMPTELLKRFDKNKDGELDVAERAAARKAFWQQGDRRRNGDDEQGLPPRRRGERPIFSEILKRFDKNRDGMLDEAERAEVRRALAQRRPREKGTERRRSAAHGDGRGDQGGKEGARPPQRRRRGGDGPPRCGRDKGDEQ